MRIKDTQTVRGQFYKLRTVMVGVNNQKTGKDDGQ